jgi:antitoxin YefM
VRRKTHHDGGLKATLHLLRSPRNAWRLLAALHRAERGEGNPKSVDELRRSVGIKPDN